jgi:hypothetical protein
MSDYERHAHRVQTAIAALMAVDPNFTAIQPKHLRVGIDMSKSDAGGLAGLLISKGIFTAEEYIEAVTAAAAEEADSYERQLQAVLSHRGIRTG